jgi:hypothetical protein
MQSQPIDGLVPPHILVAVVAAVATQANSLLRVRVRVFFEAATVATVATGRSSAPPFD